MKTPTLKKCLGGRGILLVALLILPLENADAAGGGVAETYKNATAPFDDEKQVDAALSLPIPSVLVTERYQGGRFWVETRKDKMQRFKCSQCHNNKPVRIAKAAKIAHGQIILNHGSEARPLSCYTCHKKDERDFLITEQGTKIDMNHSYQMCGQCHFRQKKDWVGGAHGKRISYWAGRRVVKNCTGCHDPHSPRFKKRWPVIYSPPLSKSK
jgi:formate-dependent nitrite reductase cytochrome c552 subunit